MNAFRAFGLNLSTDLHFPELFPLEATGTNRDVEVFAASPDLEGFDDDTLPQSTARFVLHLKKVGRFLIEGGTRITYRRNEGIDDDLLRLYLLGTCMGALLQQRGYVVLHGNAVSTDGETCRVIAGHSGAGKSTEAAWHYREGAGILADDVCAVDFGPDGRPRVIPSYPQIKLWRASADLLGVPVEGLRRIHGREDKFAIPLGARFAAEPLRLTEVIELSPDNTAPEALVGMAKVNRLLTHSYRPRLLERMGIKADYLKKVMRLAGAIEVRTGVRRKLGAP